MACRYEWRSPESIEPGSESRRERLATSVWAFFITNSFPRTLDVSALRGCLSCLAEKLNARSRELIPLRNWQWFFIACNSLSLAGASRLSQIASLCPIALQRTVLCVFCAVRHRWERDFVSIVGAIPLAYIFQSVHFALLSASGKKVNSVWMQKCFILD